MNNLLHVTGVRMTGFALKLPHFLDSKSHEFYNQSSGRRKKERHTYFIMSEMYTLFHILTFLKWGWAFTTNVMSKFNHQPFVFLNGIQ